MRGQQSSGLDTELEVGWGDSMVLLCKDITVVGKKVIKKKKRQWQQSIKLGTIVRREDVIKIRRIPGSKLTLLKSLIN